MTRLFITIFFFPTLPLVLGLAKTTKANQAGDAVLFDASDPRFFPIMASRSPWERGFWQLMMVKRWLNDGQCWSNAGWTMVTQWLHDGKTLVKNGESCWSTELWKLWPQLWWYSFKLADLAELFLATRIACSPTIMLRKDTILHITQFSTSHCRSFVSPLSPTISVFLLGKHWFQ